MGSLRERGLIRKAKTISMSELGNRETIRTKSGGTRYDSDYARKQRAEKKEAQQVQATPRAKQVLQQVAPEEAKTVRTVEATNETKAPDTPTQKYEDATPRAAYLLRQDGQTNVRVRRDKSQTGKVRKAYRGYGYANQLTKESKAQFKQEQDTIWANKYEQARKNPSYSEYSYTPPKRDVYSKYGNKARELGKSAWKKGLGEARYNKYIGSKEKYFTPEYYIQKAKKQPEPTDKYGKRRMKLKGAVLDIWETVEYKPLKTGINIGLGAATGGAMGLVKKPLTKVATYGVLAVGTGVYGGVKTYKYLKAPTSFEKGRVLGGTVKEVFEFGAGYNIASPRASTTTSKTSTFRSKTAEKNIPPPKSKASKTDFNPNQYTNLRSYKTKTGQKTFYAINKATGERVTITKNQATEITRGRFSNVIKGKKGSFGGSRVKEVTPEYEPKYELSPRTKNPLTAYKPITPKFFVSTPSYSVVKTKGRSVGKPRNIPPKRPPAVRFPTDPTIRKPLSLEPTRPRPLDLTKPKDIIPIKPKELVPSRDYYPDRIRPEPEPKPIRPGRPSYVRPKVPIGGLPGFPFGLPSASYTFGKGTYRMKSKQPKAYIPSGFAAAFNIKGKATKFGIKSGLGLRPIKIK